MTDHSDLIERIAGYLATGGLFNPELANHDAVRDLLIESRDAFSSQSLSLSEAREEIERLKGLVAGIRECPQEPWQDIATAPKDGTFVITCVAGFVPGIAHWATYGDVTRWGADPETFMEEDHFLDYWVACRYDPTHWMPLPPRPSALENGPVREALQKLYDGGVACHDLWFFKELKQIIAALSQSTSAGRVGDGA